MNRNGPSGCRPLSSSNSHTAAWRGESPRFPALTGQFPALAPGVEDHEDTVGVPEGDQCRRQWCVRRWGLFRAADEGDQGVPAVVDRQRWYVRRQHLAVIPGMLPELSTPVAMGRIVVCAPGAAAATPDATPVAAFAARARLRR